MKRIGIKRRWWFGYKWFDCEHFYFRSGVQAYTDKNFKIRAETKGLWLVIQCADRDVVIPDIEQRGYIVYPERKKQSDTSLSEETAHGLQSETGVVGGEPAPDHVPGGPEHPGSVQSPG